MKTEKEINEKLLELETEKEYWLNADGDNMTKYEDACDKVKLLKWILDK